MSCQVFGRKNGNVSVLLVRGRNANRYSNLFISILLYEIGHLLLCLWIPSGIHRGYNRILPMSKWMLRPIMPFHIYFGPMLIWNRFTRGRHYLFLLSQKQLEINRDTWFGGFSWSDARRFQLMDLALCFLLSKRMDLQWVRQQHRQQNDWALTLTRCLPLLPALSSLPWTSLNPNHTRITTDRFVGDTTGFTDVSVMIRASAEVIVTEELRAVFHCLERIFLKRRTNISCGRDVELYHCGTSWRQSNLCCLSWKYYQWYNRSLPLAEQKQNKILTPPLNKVVRPADKVNRPP